MSYNRRPMQKRGGRIKNNFIDNISIRRSNPCHNMPYATSTRSNISNFNTENNVQSVSDFYDDHKTLYILCKYYLGNFVTIKTETEEYNGVLRAVSPNGDFCLTEATVFVNQSELVSRYEKFKMIPIKDIIIVEAKNVDSNYSFNSLDQDKILTDEEIVKRRRSNHNMDHNQYDFNGSSDIELTPFYDSSVPLEDNCLNASKVGAHWFPPEEMFEKNKISFNVKSTYNENLEGYTTQLNKEDPNFERDLIIAQKKALEIEKDHDSGMDHLENGDEENEELLFCSIVRSSESHKYNDTENQITNSQGKTSQHIRNYTGHNVITSTEDFIDQKHNLNPNAREFTPISSSVSYCDVNNITMQMNSMNIQNQNSFPNIVHPSNYIPYSIPVMFPHHMPNSVPLIQHPGMEQFLISRQNVITNYSIPPFFVPNQCQVTFDPNLMNPTSSRFENNFQNSIQNEINYDRENISNEFEGRNESNEIENIQIHEEIKREDTDNQKKHMSIEDFKVLKDSTSALHESQFNTGSNHNYEHNEAIPNYQKINSSLACSNPRMYSQVVTGNSQAYILPNVAHGIRHIGNYPQVMPNQISYITNYFPRQSSLIAPIHQVIPNMIPNPQMHQSMQVPIKSLGPQNSNFPPGFPSNSFVPVINSQINGQNFHTLLPGYPQSLPAAINAHLQIPIQHNMPQFSQFIAPIQQCNYLNSMQLPPSQQN